MQDIGISVIFKGNNLLRLLGGLWVTLKLSLISVTLSVILGILFGMIMTSKSTIIKIISRIYLEIIRIVPQLVLLFIFYFGVAKAFSVNISGQMAAIIVFTLWGAGEMGDLVRGALQSIPPHQYESGMALGLTRVQILQYIIVPQTLRRLIPLSMNLTTRMIKTTSLVTLIGVIEVLKVGQQIIEAARFDTPSSAIWIYGVVFFLYFIICYPISKAAKKLEQIWQN